MTDYEFTVELPGGGETHLQSDDEVDRWNRLRERYMADYRLTKINDLTTLDTILLQQLTVYRAQRRLSGMEPEFDEENLPTGRWQKVELSSADVTGLQGSINTASKEIRELEKALGIDKKSRDQSGNETVADYLKGLKELGHEYGVHISRRVWAFEEFVNELRWRLRLEQAGDAEDKAYHECTPEGILKWAREELDKLVEADQRWGQEKGKLFVGRV